MADDQNQRVVSLEKVIGPKIPFIGNRSIRIASGALVAILFIFLLGAMGTSAVVLGQLFWAPNKDDSYNILKLSDKDHKEWKRALESSLGLCGAVVIVILILLILYFIYLRVDFEFSERLSTNLSIATQGPNRLRKVAGLLTDYVYPKGSVSDDVRANLANQFIMRLRDAYTTHNDIGQLTPEQYNKLNEGDKYKDIRTAEGFVPGSATPTAEEYDLLRKLAMRESNGTMADANEKFKNFVDEYKKNLSSGNGDEIVKNLGGLSPQQRQDLIYSSNNLKTPQKEAEAAAEKAKKDQEDAAEQAKRDTKNAYDKKLAALNKQKADAETEETDRLNEHKEAQSELYKAKTKFENAKNAKDKEKYAGKVGETSTVAQNAQEKWNMAKQNTAQATQALQAHMANSPE